MDGLKRKNGEGRFNDDYSDKIVQSVPYVKLLV